MPCLLQEMQKGCLFSKEGEAVRHKPIWVRRGLHGLPDGLPCKGHQPSAEIVSQKDVQGERTQVEMPFVQGWLTRRCKAANLPKSRTSLSFTLLTEYDLC
jgi:hypothetical protein